MAPKLKDGFHTRPARLVYLSSLPRVRTGKAICANVLYSAISQMSVNAERHKLIMDHDPQRRSTRWKHATGPVSASLTPDLGGLDQMRKVPSGKGEQQKRLLLTVAPSGCRAAATHATDTPKAKDCGDRGEYLGDYHVISAKREPGTGGLRGFATCCSCGSFCWAVYLWQHAAAGISLPGQRAKGCRSRLSTFFVHLLSRGGSRVSITRWAFGESSGAIRLSDVRASPNGAWADSGS